MPLFCANTKTSNLPVAMSWLTLPQQWLQQKWGASATNRWGEVVEQFDSRHNAYRHKTFDDYLKASEWKSGPHPIAQKLRDEGKDETECFRNKSLFKPKASL